MKKDLLKAKITLTNSLDEQLIRSLREQGACVDMYGVGDAIAVSNHILVLEECIR